MFVDVESLPGTVLSVVLLLKIVGWTGTENLALQKGVETVCTYRVACIAIVSSLTSCKLQMITDIFQLS